MKKTLLLILAVFAYANETFAQGSIKYSRNGDEAYVSGVNNGGPSGVVAIPETVTFYEFESGDYKEIVLPVTSIADEALWGCSSMTKLIVPEGVRSIGRWGLALCEALESVELPSTLTSVGEEVFYACSSLKTVNLPSSITSFGNNLFAYSGIESFTIPSWMTTVPNGLFSYCEKLSSLTIEEGVERLDTTCFQGATALKDLVLPSTLKVICNYAFSDCRSLESITIPSNVEAIEDLAFRWCNDLRTVDFSKATSLTAIGEQAFCDCGSLVNVNMSNCTSLKSIGSYCFYYCRSLPTVYLPEGLETIGTGCFDNCNAFKGITLPASLKQMGKYSFFGDELVEYIDFSKCEQLTMTSIDSWLFDLGLEESVVAYAPGPGVYEYNGRPNVIFGSRYETGIKHLNADGTNASTPTFDISGRSINSSHTRPRIQISKGHKYIVR